VSERTDAAIGMRGVSRTFGTGSKVVHALGPVDLDIGSGEFVCLVGPSGCGKSTLLRLVGKLLRPSDGVIDLAVSAGAGGPGRASTAVVFQEYSIFPWRTVEQNIRLGLDVAGMRRSEAKKRARVWIERLGLTGFADVYPATLSGGMKQRVSIARALAVDPEILLMDEPFAALDAQLRLILQEELLQLWQSDQRTVLFVTHSLDEAILLGDRVVVMSARPGRIIADITVPFGRPRTADVRASGEFAALEREIWDLLRAEVTRTMAPVPSAAADAVEADATVVA
jgi:NitT/TauT family transport system ATP-binding protein